jgi:hypothetical protein
LGQACGLIEKGRFTRRLIAKPTKLIQNDFAKTGNHSYFFSAEENIQSPEL